MKCPNCQTEIELADKETIVYVKKDWLDDWFFPNFVFVTFTSGTLFHFLLPWDIDHGYALNYDLILALGVSMVYVVYLILYGYGKVEGRFVWKKKS